jgi:hypothetical protein
MREFKNKLKPKTIKYQSQKGNYASASEKLKGTPTASSTVFNKLVINEKEIMQELGPNPIYALAGQFSCALQNKNQTSRIKEPVS